VFVNPGNDSLAALAWLDRISVGTQRAKQAKGKGGVLGGQAWVTVVVVLDYYSTY